MNRKILVEQLLKDLEHIDNEYRRKGEYSIKKYIRIVTYQNIETYYINSKEGHPWLGGADFIVCDEAHYFLNDALFNTNTYRSYILINQQTQRVPIIFISATMSIEKEIMFNIDWQSRISVYNKPDSYSPIFNSKSYMENKYNKYVYERERNYNYLDIKAFSNVEQIPDIVCNEKNGKKWLIFINHIEKGKEIANRIKARERDAVFIDSQYTADEESLGAVKVIAEEEIMNHDIIIATSALDNGISIKDLALRSMIIVAETEMELI